MKNKKIFMIVVLLVFSIIGNGNFLMQNQSLKEATVEKETALTDANNQLTQLQSSVTDLQTQVEELQAKSTVTDSSNASTETENTDQEDYYIVKKGDTLATISMIVYGNKEMVEKICELNNIENDNKLKEGQKLLLP